MKIRSHGIPDTPPDPDLEELQGEYIRRTRNSQVAREIRDIEGLTGRDDSEIDCANVDASAGAV